MTPILLVALALLIIAASLIRARYRSVIVYEYERGLLYESGRFHALVEPGKRWLWTPTQSVTKVDVRPRITAVPNQEVLTADGITVKLSLVAQFQVADPVLAINGNQSYESALYTELQLSARHIVSTQTIDELLKTRASLGDQLTERSRAHASTLGLTLIKADIKDLTLPGDLKKLFTQVTKARQDGLAALERARGETAALRSLANAARLVEDNPALMQLRLLQVVGEQTGNTIVLGTSPNGAPMPIAKESKNRSDADSRDPEP